MPPFEIGLIDISKSGGAMAPPAPLAPPALWLGFCSGASFLLLLLDKVDLFLREVYMVHCVFCRGCILCIGNRLARFFFKVNIFIIINFRS